MHKERLTKTTNTQTGKVYLVDRETGMVYEPTVNLPKDDLRRLVKPTGEIAPSCPGCGQYVCTGLCCV